MWPVDRCFWPTYADRIVVLDQGVVVEEGTHSDLLARQGRYAALWQRQASEATEEAA